MRRRSTTIRRPPTISMRGGRTLEDTERTARRVFGGTHPTVVDIEDDLRMSQSFPRRPRGAAGETQHRLYAATPPRPSSPLSAPATASRHATRRREPGSGARPRPRRPNPRPRGPPVPVQRAPARLPDKNGAVARPVARQHVVIPICYHNGAPGTQYNTHHLTPSTRQSSRHPLQLNRSSSPRSTETIL